MKSVLFSAVLILGSSAALAMPCDVAATRVSCVSSSGKYSFTTLTCGYDQSLSGAELTVKGEPDATAEVKTQWFGTAFYGVEFNIISSDDSERVVSFEWSAKTNKGTVLNKTRDGNPAPWNEKSEKINCKVEDANDN